MIKYEVITSIDDIVFDNLFGHSVEAMDAGSYPWHLFPNVVTYQEKRDHIRTAFEQVLEEGIVFHVVEDDHVLMLNGGKLDGTTLNWFLGLIGPNKAGSKSYLYDPVYEAARDKFWVDHNISVWNIETMGVGTAMHDHVVNAVNVGAIKNTLSSEDRDMLVVKATDLRLVV